METKTQEEINEQVEKLKAIRPKVKPYSAFGDDNLAKLDAQVKVLEEDMDSDDVWDEWPRDEADMETRMAADDAINWRDDNSSGEDDLAKDWPMI